MNKTKCKHCFEKFERNIFKHEEKCFYKPENIKTFFSFLSNYDYTLNINSNKFSYYKFPLPNRIKIDMFFKNSNITQTRVFYFDRGHVSLNLEELIDNIFVVGITSDILKLTDWPIWIRIFFDHYGYLTKEEWNGRIKVAERIENLLMNNNY